MDRLAALALSTAVASCGGVPPPARPPAPQPAAPAVDPLTPSQRILALMTEDSPRLVDLAVLLHRLGDATALREASGRLVAMARDRLSQDFRDRLHNALDPARRARGGRGVEARLDDQQDEAATTVLEAMRWIGGPEIVAYCFDLAEQRATPPRTLRAALAVLAFNVDPSNEPLAQRRDALSARLPVPELLRPPPDDAGAGVLLRRGAMRCYKLELERTPKLEARVRLTLEVDADGDVISATAEGDAPGDLARCLEAVGRSVLFSRSDEAHRSVAVPMSFIVQK